MTRLETIKKFAEKKGAYLWGLSVMSDDFRNQIETHIGTKISNRVGNMTWLITLALFISLLIEKTKDILSSKESNILQKEILKSIQYSFTAFTFGGASDLLKKNISLVNNSEANSKADQFVKIIKLTLTSYFKEQKKGRRSTALIYSLLLLDSDVGEFVPDEFIGNYINQKVENFEKETIVQELVNNLTRAIGHNIKR